MKRGRKVLLGGIAVVAVFAYLGSRGEQSQDDSSFATSPPSTALVETPGVSEIGEFRVVSVEDYSVKAMTQPLSSYTAAELEALPMSVRLSVNAVVGENILQEQVGPTLREIVAEASADNPDADEITVFLYSEEGLVGGAYDVGSALWAPYGERGRVTPDIANSNDRSTYVLSLSIRDDVESYLARRSLDEERFGLTLEQRRVYYYEVAQAELRSMLDADEEVDPRVDVMANIERQRELLDEYVERIRATYGLGHDEHRAILAEGLENRWPTD